MRCQLSISCLILVIISGMVAGGCASRDARRTSLYMGNDQKRLEKQKARLSATEETLKDLPEMTAEDYETVGDQYFRQNDLPMAFVHYDKALRMASNKINLRYKKGLVFLKRGLTEDALRAFQEVLKTDDTFALAYEGVGQAFLMMGNLREAERNFQRVIALDTSQWKSHNFLGMIYDQQKRFEKAIAFYKSAIAFEKNNGLLFNNLGISYYRQGNYGEATRAFEEALTMRHTEAKVYNNLGLSLAKLGRYQEALIAFTQGGDQAKAYNNLGVIYLTEGKYQEATAAFEEAMARSPRYYTKASENLRMAQQALGASHANPDILSILSGKSDAQTTR